MNTITIFAPHDSPRLRYILHWIFEDCLNLSYVITRRPADDAHIAYGTGGRAAVTVPDEGLLWQSGVPQYAPHFQEGGVKAGIFAFDVFSAAFYHLTRCEEYAPFIPDKHGRFPHTASILGEHGFLDRPIVDAWVERLRIALVNHCGLAISKPVFRFQPTYDIDIAYAYHHKGLKRTLGGLIRDAQARKFVAVRERIRVLGSGHQDPYDAYAFLQSLHAKHRLKPNYFFLAAQHPTTWDKNIPPTHPAFRSLVQEVAMQGEVGMHPSYFSFDKETLIAEEKLLIERAVGKPIFYSRQHYIRLRFPQTYRALIAAGVSEDWSMGYPDAAGFRAGTSQSFLWYDLEREEQTVLRVHPFSFMDVTARDYQRWSLEDAFENLRAQRKTLQAMGGVLTTVFHNFSLGSAEDWKGWKKAYETFVAETSSSERAGLTSE
jgi:hypothetical protein